MASSVEIKLEAGTDTEPLLESVMKALTDEEIDETAVKREFAPATGLASEPITLAVLVVASLKAATAMATAIAAYIKFKTEKMKAEHTASGRAPDPVSIVIRTSPTAPSSLRNLQSTEHVRVKILL